jgi:hypothetical protein
MITTRMIKRSGVAAVGLLLVGLTGCQTWVGGMTLPSGYYQDHRPQYFRPDPDFPLQKELATQQGYDRLAIGGAAGVPGPAVPLEGHGEGTR